MRLALTSRPGKLPIKPIRQAYGLVYNPVQPLEDWVKVWYATSLSRAHVTIKGSNKPQPKVKTSKQHHNKILNKLKQQFDKLNLAK